LTVRLFLSAMETQNNCKFKCIHRSKVGEIYQCLQCQNLRVDLGRIVAVVSETSLILLTTHLIQRRNQLAQTHVDPRRKFYIDLNGHNLFLALKFEEMNKIIELFSITNHMLEAQKILNPSE